MHLYKKKKCEQRNNKTRKQCLLAGKHKTEQNKKYSITYQGPCFFKDTSPPGTVKTGSAGNKSF